MCVLKFIVIGSILSLYRVFALGYHLPSEDGVQNEGGSDDNVQSYFDVDADFGLSENKPFDVFSELKPRKLNPGTSQIQHGTKLSVEETSASGGTDKPDERQNSEEPIVTEKPFSTQPDLSSENNHENSGYPRDTYNLIDGGQNAETETSSPAPSTTSRAPHPKLRNKKPWDTYNLIDGGQNAETETSSPTPSTTSRAPHPKLRNKKFREVIGNTEKQPTNDIISNQEIAALLLNSGKGSSTMMMGCTLPYFQVKSRCSSNILELTVTSRYPLHGLVRLLEADGQVTMDGTDLVVYGVYGHRTPSGNSWRLTNEVQKSDIIQDCYDCDVFNVRLVLKTGDSTCGMEVSCQQKGSLKMVTFEEEKMKKAHDLTTSHSAPESVTPTPAPLDPQIIQDPSNTAKTTMTLVRGSDLEGPSLMSEVSLGTRLTLVLSVFSKDITLDLHVIKCHAKAEDGSGLVLVKDGCSASAVIGEFREVLGLVHDNSFGGQAVRRVTQFADLHAFNTRSTPQNITLICTLKMCGGECSERPACVRSDINIGRSKRPPVPLFEQEITLGKVYSVGGIPPHPSKDIASKILEVDNPLDRITPGPAVFPEECYSRRTVLVALGCLTGVYLTIFVLCIYHVRRSAAMTVAKRYMDDYESPPRAQSPRSLFVEYSSPRKRTPPKMSSEYTSYSLDTDKSEDPSASSSRKRSPKSPVEGSPYVRDSGKIQTSISLQE